MNHLFSQLSRREKLMVMTGLGLLLMLLGYLLIGRPLTARLDAYAHEIPAQRELLTWIKQASLEVNRLRLVRHPATGAGEAASTLSLVNKSAKELQLDRSIKRVEPTEERGVRVWLDEVSFDGMIPWLALLQERQGLSVTDIAVERGKGEGRVNALITFSAGPP